MSQLDHRLVILRPREAFSTPENALRIADIPNLSAYKLYYFDVQTIAVIVGTDGHPHAEASSFLLEKARLSRGVTGDTARSYGEALRDWLNFLQLTGCNLSEVTEERLGLYRLHLLAPSPRGRCLRANSANHRLVVAAEFHRWGQRTKTVTSPLGAFLLESRQDSRSRRSPYFRSRNPVSYLAAVDKRLPKILTQEEIVRLFKVAPRPFDLMFRWAIATGARRMEICNLRLGQLPSADAISRQEGGLVMIDVHRKGGQLKSLVVPSRLIEETIWYILTERSSFGEPETDHIFVGRGGGSISRQRMTRVFRECANAIGSAATLHHLRHTFAVNVLQALDQYEGSGQAMNPLKTVQVLLGHASLSTTQIYLEALSMSSDAVRQALDYLYGGTIE